MDRFDYIHIGILGISSYAQFWESLERLYYQDTMDYGLNDLRAVGDTLMISGLNAYKNLDYLFETETNFAPEELKRANFLQYFAEEDIFVVDMDLKLIRGESAAKLILYASKRYKNYLKHKLKVILRLQK